MTQARLEQGPIDGLERIVLGLAAALAVIALAFLGLSVVAAALFGAGRLEAGIAEATHALFRLGGHLSDPASAWAEPARRALPGPVAYWGVLLSPLPGLGALGVAGMRVARRLRRGRRPLGTTADSGVGRRLKALEVRRPTLGRLTLGRVGGHLVAGEEGASLAVIGPSGCGKTVGFAIPALLEWDGPVIATSVKTDLLKHTLAKRREFGRVWVYDPSGCTGVASDRWSPLSSCGTWAGARKMAALLCEVAEPKRSVNDSDYWLTQAQKALAPHLYAAAVAGATMADVVRWIDAQEVQALREALGDAAGLPRQVAEAMGSNEGERLRREVAPAVSDRVTDEHRRQLLYEGGKRAKLASRSPEDWPPDVRGKLEEAIEAELELAVRAELEVLLLRKGGRALDPLVSAEALWAKEERLRSSIYATVENVLLAYGEPAVADANSGCDIDLDEWLSGPNTVYVIAPQDDQELLRPVLSVLLATAVRRAYAAANANGGRLERPCLVLLDEAGNVAPLRDLPAYAATARSHGITLVSVWQDLSQIRAIYGDLAPVVISNHRARIFGNAIGDTGTLDTASRLVGDEEVRERSWSKNPDGPRSISEHTAYRRAAPPEAIRRMPENQALLVYGSAPPVRLRLRPFYEDRSLRKFHGD